MSDTIKIENPRTYEPMTVSKDDYVKAKTKDLQAFGYPSLTEDDVRSQLEKALSGEPLDVIGQFIKGDLILE
jgi:hypothetical protein